MKTLASLFIPPIVSRFVARIGRPSSRPLIIEANLKDCVHPYCGFRYGKQEYNPYETYQIAVHEGHSIQAARREFIDFLRHYRPRHFGEALGIHLTRPWAACVYPWDDRDPGDWRNHGWRSNPDESPDLLTHFSEVGIQSFRIEEEFFWLERALRSILFHGYHPERFGPAQALELRRKDGKSAFLLLDGNHRAGALVAIGVQRSLVVCCHAVVHEESVDSWPSVRAGRISRSDALKIFHAFFSGNTTWSRSPTPAPIIAPAQWCELYGI